MNRDEQDFHSRGTAADGALRPAVIRRLRGPLGRLLAVAGLALLAGPALAAPSSAGPEQGQLDCTEYMLNGSFETGDLSGWESSGNPGVDDLAHDGTWAAALGGEDNADEWIAQSYSLPADPLTATLRYWIFIGTRETGNGAYDHLRVEARGQEGELLAELGVWNNGQASEIWLEGYVDLREYPALLGRSLRLQFRATTDSSIETIFYLDGMSLTLCENPIRRLDPYEPNDRVDQARAFDPGKDLFAYICDAEDHDFYGFSADEGEWIAVLLDGGAGAPLPADYEMVLYNPEGNFVAKSERSGSLPEDLRVRAVQGGIWFLRIYGYQGASSDTDVYRLRVDLEPNSPDPPTPPVPVTMTPTPAVGPSASPTATEDDPIGSTETPTPVGFATPTPTPTTRYPGCADPYEPNDFGGESLWSILNAPRLSYLCSASDQDLLQIEQVAISQTLEVRLWDLPADYRLELLWPDGSLVRMLDRRNNVEERIVFTANQAGDWFARVSSRGAFDPARPYTVAAGAYACVLDSNEGVLGNDDQAQATGLNEPGAGWTEAAQSICPARDEDWFSVPLREGRRFTAEIAHTRGQDHVRLCMLRKDDATPVACTPGQAGTEKIVRDIAAGESGTYYLRVAAADSAQPINAWYNLNLSAPGPTEPPTASPTPTATATPVRPYPNCPDTYEPNDSPADASAMPTSGWVEAYMCAGRTVIGPDGKPRQQEDEDWWKVDVLPEAGNPGQAIFAQLDLRDYEVEWFAPDGKTSLGRGRSDSGKPPRIASASGTRGTYYVRVRESAAEGYNERDPYRLTISTERCNDRYEPNDSFRPWSGCTRVALMSVGSI